MIPNERVRHAAARDAFLEYLRSDFDSTSEKLVFFKETLEIIKEILTEEPANLTLIVKPARKQITKKKKVKPDGNAR
jgi:hypothetical protein